MKAYIAGGLTNTEGNNKTFYEAIAQVCQECQIVPYLPHLKTDPVKNPDITPTEVYFRNYRQIKESDLLIAYVGWPSLGVGTELEIARQEKTKIILLYEEGSYISRMVKGNPVVIYSITFRTQDEGLQKLKEYLQNLVKNKINLIIEGDPQNPELYQYLDESDKFMQEAYKEASQSGCGSKQTGAVIVKEGKIIAHGHNAPQRHPSPCPRLEQKLPSGVGYELCPLCGPENHAEAQAIYQAQNNKIDTNDGKLYLWGHWWACLPCWEKILKAGIKEVYLVKNSKELFKERGMIRLNPKFKVQNAK